MLFAAVFAIAVGTLMIIQWAITMVRKQVDGPGEGISGRGKIEMGFHWTAEFLTAVLLIISGAGLISAAGWGKTIFLVAAGMLIYTVINSPGFFAQQRKWSMVVMFSVLLVLSIASVVLVV
ncbi:MAG: hypothetical protein JXA46_09945 [Dehalococcoidales bacterium]|nr:hypothetical protein [Dehalococcoidales bacterium]